MRLLRDCPETVWANSEKANPAAVIGMTSQFSAPRKGVHATSARTIPISDQRTAKDATTLDLDSVLRGVGPRWRSTPNQNGWGCRHALKFTPNSDKKTHKSDGALPLVSVILSAVSACAGEHSLSITVLLGLS